MSPIKGFNLTYEALNEEETFSAGDTIIGTVSFTLTKETKVKCLMVKAKGDAHVDWSEGTGDNKRSYSAHRRYFKLKEYLLAENAKGTVLPQGVHRFKFSFTIPQGDMPSSFKGFHGKIVYMLEAKISRSWRLPSFAQKELKFISKSFSYCGQVMDFFQCPQSGSVLKEMGVFSKGHVQMSATINKKVCSPGDTLSVVAKIHNSSSKNTRPKYSLQQKVVYRASGSTTTSDRSLCKMVGETITPNSEETVSCQLEIPADVVHTIHNCEILTVEYYLKVYLDISCAIDPEVVFPLVIAPASFAALQTGEAVEPYPPGAAGAPSYGDFPPPAFPMGPYPVPIGSGGFGYLAPDPTQHGNITSGWNNQWPQQAPPYGYPTAASSSAQNQGSTAPPLFQQGEEPPSYTSLFFPSQDPLGRTGSDQKS